MRIIKFRSWDEENKKMGGCWQLKDMPQLIMSCLSHNDSTIKIMQFAGLNDKNGNDIYEGDILKRSKEAKPSFLVVIEFKHGMFGGTTKPYNAHFIEMRRLPVCDHDGKGYDEIIGNIYENPELLPE